MRLDRQGKTQTLLIFIHHIKMVTTEAQLVRTDADIRFHHRRAGYKIDFRSFKLLVKQAEGAVVVLFECGIDGYRVNSFVHIFHL